MSAYGSDPEPWRGRRRRGAAGTAEWKERFLARVKGDEPSWGAMASIEPSAGSDSAGIQAPGRREGDHWVLNGTQIFCANSLVAAEKSKGFVVVWAPLGRSAGKPR